MPLYTNAIVLIKANLIAISNGLRAQYQEIGFFTETQFSELNNYQEKLKLPKLESNKILYLGRHHYNRRCNDDGYEINDLILQIISALDETSVIVSSPRMTTMENRTLRNDGYGNSIRDVAVFELSAKKPKAELYSLIPKGDTNKPKSEAKKPT